MLGFCSQSCQSIPQTDGCTEKWQAKTIRLYQDIHRSDRVNYPIKSKLFSLGPYDSLAAWYNTLYKQITLEDAGASNMIAQGYTCVRQVYGYNKTKSVASDEDPPYKKSKKLAKKLLKQSTSTLALSSATMAERTANARAPWTAPPASPMIMSLGRRLNAATPMIAILPATSSSRSYFNKAIFSELEEVILNISLYLLDLES